MIFTADIAQWNSWQKSASCKSNCLNLSSMTYMIAVGWGRCYNKSWESKGLNRPIELKELQNQYF